MLALESRVLLKTVLMSSLNSLAMNLTNILEELLRDLKKPTYLDARIVFGGMEFEKLSIRYIWVYIVGHPDADIPWFE